MTTPAVKSCTLILCRHGEANTNISPETYRQLPTDQAMLDQAKQEISSTDQRLAPCLLQAAIVRDHTLITDVLSPLTDQGRCQAFLLAEKISGKMPVAIATSPYLRAFQTAREILKAQSRDEIPTILDCLGEIYLSHSPGSEKEEFPLISEIVTKALDQIKNFGRLQIEQGNTSAVIISHSRMIASLKTLLSGRPLSAEKGTSLFKDFPQFCEGIRLTVFEDNTITLILD